MFCTVTDTFVSRLLELFLITDRKEQLFETLQMQIHYIFWFLCLSCCTLEQGLEALYRVKLVFIVNCIYSCCAVRDISESALVSWGNFTSNYCLWTKLNRPLTKKPRQVPMCPRTVLGLQHNCWRFRMSSVGLLVVLLLRFNLKCLKSESCRRCLHVCRWKHQLYYLLRATTYKKQAPLWQSTIDSLLRDTKNRAGNRNRN